MALTLIGRGAMFFFLRCFGTTQSKQPQHPRQLPQHLQQSTIRIVKSVQPPTREQTTITIISVRPVTSAPPIAAPNAESSPVELPKIESNESPDVDVV